MELDELKLFLRVDGEEEDELIQGLQLAAEEYLINAGVNKDYSKELYKLAVKLLVTHWYNNREVTGKADRLAFSLDTIILQLKYT
ncbi:MAG: phage gp6-like head-tail connector protein [Clostridium thermopalmarium]|uniref:head-tail connector protein n=1 Tax=Clostridium thermopalmarium TaxID=29373 RepID=UPI002356BB74|nr:head-tail connector protein [Clostridium thermopalmarium]MBE6043546.1 phage gp6-like head-tail connector protein [Clostridium thermopalmarium]